MYLNVFLYTAHLTQSHGGLQCFYWVEIGRQGEVAMILLFGLFSKI